MNTRQFRNALKRAGISDYRFHDNRHTWASMLVQNGVSLYELQEMGAWQSTEMVKRYAYFAPEKMKEKGEIADRLILPSVTILSQTKLQ
ncbi:MAG: tyrosine-type recombinase/integrase [Oxalobacter formigenes]|nr:tyrosine-type recombinase/integrase [Oxalobacter formigenes]